MKKIKFEDSLRIYSWNIGILFLLMLFYLINLSVIMHFFHVPISRLYLPLAVLGSFISLFFLRKKEKTQTFISFLIFILLFLLFILLTGLIYSNGWDENAYHKIEVGLLKNGWNPFY